MAHPPSLPSATPRANRGAQPAPEATSELAEAARRAVEAARQPRWVRCEHVEAGWSRRRCDNGIEVPAGADVPRFCALHS